MAATRLFFTASVEEQWQAVAGPWLRAQAASAWKSPEPTVILTPSRAEGFYLRSRLVEEGVPYLGLRFWTPSDARKFLLAEISPDFGSATLADQRLLARACAENLVDHEGSDNATISSVIRDPGAFLRAYDLLLGAGWDPAREGAEYGRLLAREMQRVLKKAGVATQAGLHRHLRRKASALEEPLLANLLVIGFNATHWPLWDLLQAVVRSSEETVLALAKPRSFAESIDQLWISSWEEITGVMVLDPPLPILEDEKAAPFFALVASYEQGTSAQSTTVDLTFRITPDLTSQIRAVTLQALDYLRRDSCTRLGIVFAEANALALGVADELRRLNIPLDNSIGSTSPGLFERRCWQSWLALQEEPGVPRMIDWLRACEAAGVSTGMADSFSARKAANLLEHALGETLVDDLHFLALHLHDSSDNRHGHAADFLHHLILLPEKAAFSRFLTLTRNALAPSGWEDHLARLQIDPPAWLRNGDQILSRRTFLEWLKEWTASQSWTSGRDGNHFYGKVHLLIYAQMTGQTWSHLILTGLNEGVWPRVFQAGAFGSRHELTELNRRARSLNRRSAAQGGQGIGHETVIADHRFCLRPLARHDLVLRDLCAALESTSHGACLAATTTEASRSLLPSDFFAHAYQAKTGRVLDEETFRALANATDEWCRQQGSVLSGATPSSGNSLVDDLPLFSQPIRFATETAYAARRDATRPFGAYEFSYAQPPERSIQLSCKRWEEAWNHPATVWLEDVVGVMPWPEGRLSWPRAVGTWTHRWLAAALHEWQEKKSGPSELPVLIWAAADREAHIELYPWWEQVWSQARSIALGLGETLAPLLPDRPFLCELRLPRDLMIALPGTVHADFELNGRIDLLLLDPGAPTPEPEAFDFTDRTCWVIDFKTGFAQTLNAKKIGEGKGLQPLLYALAIEALGAVSTAISLHTVEAPLKPQIQLDSVLEISPVFRSLDILHRRGIFGMRPDADNAYGYSPSYPMATRFIPGPILEAKWAFVHGSASVDQREAE
jgi:hypothetical protein